MIQAFFAGFLIFNAIPHLVKGITGEAHMTPFKRKSSPYLNILWSFTNLFLGIWVIGFDESGYLNRYSENEFWAFFVGGFLLSLTAAWLFGRPNARLPWHKD